MWRPWTTPCSLYLTFLWDKMCCPILCCVLSSFSPRDCTDSTLWAKLGSFIQAVKSDRRWRILRSLLKWLLLTMLNSAQGADLPLVESVKSISALYYQAPITTSTIQWYKCCLDSCFPWTGWARQTNSWLHKHKAGWGQSARSLYSVEAKVWKEKSFSVKRQVPN